MKKYGLILAIIVLQSFLTYGQINQSLYIKDFTQKAHTAEWLFEYDMIAWWTSDSVMTQNPDEIKRLGKEWFCFKSEDDVWHAVYGNFENNIFDLVFHYEVDTTYEVKRVYKSIDTTILNGYSRALQTANLYIKPHTDSINLRLNQYIRKNEDETYNVWILSAFQTNGWAVHGKEFILKIDKNGSKIIEDNSFYDTEFLGFETNRPREIWIDQSNLDNPTLGAVFFAWYYKKYFTSIKIDSKYYITSAFKTDGSYNWIHVEKEIPKKKKGLKNLFKKRK